MILKKILLLNIIAIFLYQCNPKAILTGVIHTSDVDSVLFYQQNPVADPLLDEIQSNPGNSARLSTTLLPPPPPPPPDYKEIEGFRIQLFAGTDSISAATVHRKADTDIEDTVYLINEGGLFKIQVGDYPYRMDADNMKLTLNDKGFKGAWVVKRMVRVPRDSRMADSVVVAPPPSVPSEISPVETETTQPDKTPSAPVDEGRFKIQVMATSDMLKAQQLELELEEQFSKEAYYEQSGTVYKVFIGKFQIRSEAEKLLNYVRENGYPDAWLVY